MFEPIRARRQQNSGRQRGDPESAAQVILSLMERNDLPLQLLLGSDALLLVREKLRAMDERISEWEAVSLSTDAPL